MSRNSGTSYLLCHPHTCEVRDFFKILLTETLSPLQVGPILDTVEELVEEQSLDPLFSDKYVSCILVNPFCLLLSIYGIGLNCKSSPHILEF